MRGKPLKSFKFAARGQRISAIACISTAGLLDVMTTTDGETFAYFIRTYLLPHLRPFNGTNPHSVVIMDNCSIHHMENVARDINEVGALLHFLPSYSPDFKPIEETFLKVKAELKASENTAWRSEYGTLTFI